MTCCVGDTTDAHSVCAPRRILIGVVAQPNFCMMVAMKLWVVADVQPRCTPQGSEAMRDAARGLLRSLRDCRRTCTDPVHQARYRIRSTNRATSEPQSPAPARSRHDNAPALCRGRRRDRLASGKARPSNYRPYDRRGPSRSSRQLAAPSIPSEGIPWNQRVADLHAADKEQSDRHRR